VGVGGSGYISADGLNTLFPGFQHGASWYTNSWPMLEKPLADFQVGFAGTWFKPNNAGYPQPLCPPGTRSRDEWWDGRSNLGDYFQTIEGGLGTWGSLRFQSGNPKFKVNGTSDCYSTGQDALGWGWQNASLSCDKLGQAQLTNRLLSPPDGYVLPANPNGHLLGYGYLALPIFDERTDANGIKTGDRSWTLFLNSTNFKGPVMFWIPEFWSEIYAKDNSITGRGLDANNAFMGGAASEFGFFPRYRALDSADNSSYSRYPAIRFPVDSNTNRTTLLQDIRLYSDQAVYQRVKAWLNGGQAAASQIPSTAQRQPDCPSRTSSLALRSTGAGEEYRLALDPLVKAVTGNSPATGCALQLQWTPASGFPAGQLPEYYRRGNGEQALTPVPGSAVPASTQLQSQSFIAPRENVPFTLDPQTSSCWVGPGPAAGPFYAELEDGSTLIYFWYRFVDQPALQRMRLSEAEKLRVQSFVETLHRTWLPSMEYLDPPSSGTLAPMADALLVTPPEGLEAGYVPIVVEQRRTPPRFSGPPVIRNGPKTIAPGSLIELRGEGLAVRTEASAKPLDSLGGMTAWIGETSIPALRASATSLQLYVPNTLHTEGAAELNISVDGAVVTWPVEVKPVAPSVLANQGTLTIPGGDGSSVVELGKCALLSCTPVTVPAWEAGEGEEVTLTLFGSGFRNADPSALVARVGWTTHRVVSIEPVNDYGLDRAIVRLPATPPAHGPVEVALLTDANAPVAGGTTVLRIESKPLPKQPLSSARSITADRLGNVYWGDTPSRKVYRISPKGVSTIVYENTTGASISGLAIDSSLKLYVAEGPRIFVVDPPNPETGAPGPVRALGPQSVGDPRGLALDERRGYLYFADNGGARVRRVSLSTGTVETVAGTGRRGTAGNQLDGIPALDADLGSPLSVAVAGDGTVYFTDDGALRIRKIDAASGRLTTVVGNGSQASAPDGSVAATSPAGIPRGVGLDSSGAVVFTELIGGGKIRRVAADGKIETLVRDLGDPFAASMDTLGYYYVLDIGQRRISRHTPAAFVQGILATAE